MWSNGSVVNGWGVLRYGCGRGSVWMCGSVWVCGSV